MKGIPRSRNWGYGAKDLDKRSRRLHRLNIGPRLTLCFAFIIVAMLVGNAVLLWQFQVVWHQSERMRGVDEELILVLEAQANLMSFYERLDALAHSEDRARLIMEAGPLRAALLEDGRRTRDGLSRLPLQLRLDPTLLPTFEAIQASLPAQLDSITTLAKSADWEAVRLRLAIQVRELESNMSALVQNINRQVGEERAQALLNIDQAQRRILFILPMTAVLTLSFAGFLGLGITRSITEPLRRLMEGTTALAEGDFSQRVPAAGTDEIARLGRVFNDMVVRLQALYCELQRSEAYLAEAQKLAHTGSWAVKANTNAAVYWSEENFRIWQFDPQQGPPGREAILQRVHPEDRNRVVECAQNAFREGRDYAVEFRIVLPDETIRHIYGLGHNVFDPSGVPVEVIGTHVDVTEQRRAEQERERLRQVEADLRHLNRVSVMGELAASLSHELKQPITAAITNANTGLRWLKRDPPGVEGAREALLRAVKDGTRAAEIIDRLRSFYKKGTPPEHEFVDMNEVLSEMLVLLHGEASRHSIRMCTDLPAEVAKVKADRVQLQQVLLNLMLNGIEAMKDSGGELTVKSQLGQDGQLVISISDTGVGLPIENADQIFSAFFTTKPHGTGMGLAISRSIVAAHGGYLWATANFGRGATFYFTLPTTLEAHA